MSDRAEGTAAGQAGHRHAIQLDGMLTIHCISSQTGQTTLALLAIACDATAQPRHPGRMRPGGRP
jgi:hypothetical protein